MSTKPVREFVSPGLVAAVAASLAAHGWALGSGFFDDDFVYFFELEKLGTLSSMFHPFGQHFMASFKLIVASFKVVFGMDHPVIYFAIMLATHILNVVMLYCVTVKLGRSSTVAAAAALLWGSAPAFQPTLAWFSAYSHMLSTTAALAALNELASASAAGRPPTIASLLRLNLIVVAGGATMLTGSVTALVFPLVTFLFLPRESSPMRSALALMPAALATLGFLVGFPERNVATWVAPYNALVTFPKLVAYGVGLVVASPLVTVHGFFQQMGIFSVGSPYSAVMVSAAVAAPFLGVALWRILQGEPRERHAILGLLALSGALYGAIAVGRSAITFGNSLSWVATQDRYHYDANPALVIAIAVALAGAWPLRQPAMRWRVVVAFVGVAWVVANSYLAYDLSPGVRQAWTRGVMDVTDAAIRAIATHSPDRGTVFIRNEPFAPYALIHSLGIGYADSPGIAGYWIAFHGSRRLGNREVRFVEADRDRLHAIRRGARPEIAAMFVDPAAVEALGGQVRTLKRHAPREISNYLRKTKDPFILGRSDYEEAQRILRVLANGDQAR